MLFRVRRSSYINEWLQLGFIKLSKMQLTLFSKIGEGDRRLNKKYMK